MPTRNCFESSTWRPKRFGPTSSSSLRCCVSGGSSTLLAPRNHAPFSLTLQMRHLPKTIGLARTVLGAWLPVWLFLLVVAGVLPAAAVYLTRDIVDGLLAAIQSGAGWSAAGPLIRPSILLAVVVTTQALVRAAAAWLCHLQTELLQDHINQLIHEKSVTVGMAFYDFTEFFDHLHRAREEARYRPSQLLESLGGLLQNGVTIVAVAAMLTAYGVWVPLLLFA